jgi:hypothetical protein
MIEPGNLHDASLLDKWNIVAVELERLEHARLHDFEAGLRYVSVKKGEDRRSNLPVELLSRHGGSMPPRKLLDRISLPG